MLPLISTIFIASLLGSLHCAGMCGAFVAFAVNAPGVSRTKLLIAYNAGRLATYTLLGALAGALGKAVDLGGSLVGVQRTAAIIAGVIMVLFGLAAVLRQLGVSIPHLPGVRLKQLLLAGHRKAMKFTPIRRALAIGLLTTLLPCGWLYAFAATAAGTADPLLGALAMTVFWAGTLPALVALGASIGKLTGALAARLPLITSLVIVVVGLSTIVTRLNASAPCHDTTKACCHDGR
jgi:hypothetical protein